MKHEEDDLAIAVSNYLKLQYPKTLFAHIPNGGKRTLIEAARFKKIGVKKGMLDFLIFDRRGMCPGLFLELKILPNKPTEEQNEVMYQLKERGWMGGVHYSFDSAKNAIDAYLSK